MNYLLQTFRHRNFCLIFTAPYGDFIDTATRKLFHAEFETDGINRTKGTCAIKPKMLQYNAELKKWYKKYLKVIKDQSGMTKIRRWAVPKPSKEIIDKYERKKLRFTNELNTDLEATIKKLKAKKESMPKTELGRRIVNECWNIGIFKQKEVAKKLKKTPPTISEGYKTLAKQGFYVENYKEKWENRKVRNI